MVGLMDRGHHLIVRGLTFTLGIIIVLDAVLAARVNHLELVLGLITMGVVPLDVALARSR